MLLIDLGDIDEVYLRSLLGQCPESATLEFKRDAPGNADREKFEFLKDVSALANASGGDIILGLSEAGGVADAIVPIASESSDGLQRRLAQTMDALIEPRLGGVRFCPVTVAGGYVMVVRIPESFEAPHCVRNGSQRRFVIRNGTTISDLTMDQIRAAFGRTATLLEQTRQFIDARMKLVEAGGTWRPMTRDPKAAVYVVPLAGIAGRASLDVGRMYQEYGKLLLEMNRWGSGISRTLNLDGLIAHPGDTTRELAGYRLAHRNGAFEALQVVGSDVEGRTWIPARPTTGSYIAIAAKFLALAREQGFTGPAVVKCVLFDALDASFSTGSYILEDGRSDRSTLSLPDVWVESIEAPGDVAALLRPVMDVLWQAFGIERCMLYDSDGTFLTQ